MSIRFSCGCGRKLKVSDEKIGMKVLCASCGATLKVPKKSQDEFWEDVPEGKGEPEVDYVGALKMFLAQVLPALALLVVVVWGVYYLSSQVIVGRGDLPPLGRVAGKVTLDGQPLAGATIRFVPLDQQGKGDRKGASVAMGLTDDNGQYSLIYVKDIPGAAVGNNRVEIEAKDRNGAERIQPENNARSTLFRDVASGKNEFNFDLQSAPSSATPIPPTGQP
jgi:hypothetical protein